MPGRRQRLASGLRPDLRENAPQRLNTWRKWVAVSVDCVREQSGESSGFFICQVECNHDQ
jgi:hypothetical protein